MTKFQVETPTGVIEVEAAEDATDAEIIELAKKQYVPGPFTIGQILFFLWLLHQPFFQTFTSMLLVM
jgi:hypothetical protein